MLADTQDACAAFHLGHKQSQPRVYRYWLSLLERCSCWPLTLRHRLEAIGIKGVTVDWSQCFAAISSMLCNHLSLMNAKRVRVFPWG